MKKLTYKFGIILGIIGLASGCGSSSDSSVSDVEGSNVAEGETMVGTMSGKWKYDWATGLWYQGSSPYSGPTRKYNPN